MLRDLDSESFFKLQLVQLSYPHEPLLQQVRRTRDIAREDSKSGQRDPGAWRKWLVAWLVALWERFTGEKATLNQSVDQKTREVLFPTATYQFVHAVIGAFDPNLLPHLVQDLRDAIHGKKAPIL
ncbi:MAG: hypothetical protein ACREXS_04565 [Gammaproteobacteria bacterium]